MSLLNSIKTSLRISTTNTALDDEITDLIAAAQNDLRLSGVADDKASNEDDALIRRAVTVYVKANFGWDNPDAERLQLSYNNLKDHLALSGEYAAPREEDPAL